MLLWHFPPNTDSLWHQHQVIQSECGLNQNGWDTNLAINATHAILWKFISQGNVSFRSLLPFKVGNGLYTKFWENTWVRDVPFLQAFLCLSDFIFGKKWAFPLNLDSRAVSFGPVLRFWTEQRCNDFMPMCCIFCTLGTLAWSETFVFSGVLLCLLICYGKELCLWLLSGAIFPVVWQCLSDVQRD